MPFPVDLAQGDHESVPAVHWSVRYINGTHPPQVEMIASLESATRQTTAANRGQTATSLTIPMDAKVAIAWYEELGRELRSMGWLPQAEGVHNA
jgi:hypothetical protein